ncbi:MAG: ABC transporter permease [Thermoleophilaceae bacterium]
MSTDTQQSTSSGRRPSPAAIVLIPLAVALVVALFAWPSSRQEPRDLPVAVAGPPAAAQAIEHQLTAHEGAFDVHRYPDEAAARAAIEDRDVYGAFVATPTGQKLLTASAASSSVAQVLTQAATEGQAPTETATVQVEDIVSAPPASTGLSSAVFPLILAGTLTGLAAMSLASSGLARAGLLVTGATLGGLAATAIVQGWLDVVGGDWAANAAVLSLMIMAIGSFVAGMQALFGHVGGAVAGATMVFLGNPFSGVGSGPEMLPEPVGLIGQLMPPGAGGNLLRSTGFFDGAAAGEHLAVLGTWVVVGLAGLLVAALRDARPAAVQVPVMA